MAEKPVIRMMTRATLEQEDSLRQEERCNAGKCSLNEVHHPRCNRVSPQKQEAGSVQIRCGCAVTEHCRNTGVLCGGAPCYIVIDELELVNITHDVVRTRFLVTKQEEHRARKRAADAAEAAAESTDNG